MKCVAERDQVALVHILPQPLFLVVFLNSSDSFFICFPDFMFHQIMRSILQQNVAADIGNQEVLVACCRLNALPRVREILDNNPELVSNSNKF